MAEECVVEGCAQPVLIKQVSLCRRHYRRWQRHGDPTSGRTEPGLPLAERITSNVTVRPDGCWIWTSGGFKRGGYGVLKVAGKTRTAHRLSYEEFVGPIPDGFEIDHLCRNRACVNPDHLEAVTKSENIRREREVRARSERVEASVSA